MENNLFYKFVCYIGKCVFINLNTSADELQQPMQQAAYLLSKGGSIMVFPEGHRSTTGRVDTQNFTYGVGKLINTIPNARVLCVYLRGKNQQVSSNFPPHGDRFYCKLELMPENAFTQIGSGIRAVREISKKIINNLEQMEKEYFFNYV